MKLGTKLLIVFLLVSIVPLAGSGLVARYFSKGILEDKAFDQLTAIRDVKRLEIEGRLAQLESLMQNVRADPRFTTGLPAYAEAFANGGKDGFQYTMVQGERDFQLKVFVDAFKFSDVLLIDRDRNVVYAAKEGPDLGTNLKTGPYRASALARALGDELADTRFVDFEPYEPAGGPAAFIVTPILDNDLQPVGVAAFRFGVSLLNEIMQARAGLGETGETYLVGSDLRMRSDSVRDPEHRSVAAGFATENTGLLDRPPVKKALAGQAGAELSEGPDGKMLLTAYAPLEIGELHWAVIADLPRKEAFAAIDRTDLVLLIFGGVGVVVLILLLPLISRTLSNSIAGPIRAVIDGLSAVSAEVASASGQIASSSQSLADSTAEQASNLARSAGTLERLSERTRDTVERTQEANRISDQNHDEVLKIGTAMNRLLETIRDIKEASDETQKIIKTINEIAFQTNLLALNAAVEAARAGDAGRGFAVVAEEVRNLALRSAEAADSTNTVLETARRRSDAGVSAAEEVGKVLESVQASNEQVKRLINEIVGHSTEQAAGIEEVTQAVADLDARTQDDAAVAQQTASASHQLSAQSENLMRYTADLGRVVGARRSADNGDKEAPAGRLLEQPREEAAPDEAAEEEAAPARPAPPAPAREQAARTAAGRKVPDKAQQPAAKPAAEAAKAPPAASPKAPAQAGQTPDASPKAPAQAGQTPDASPKAPAQGGKTPATSPDAPAQAGKTPAQQAKEQPARRRTTLRDSIAWAEKGPSRPVSPEFADLGDADFKDM